ncbi:hypothetical protein [Polaromonas sp. UC242_47]|uniref:hypothetical protein n=1 Tax=Polaromonas sp. UC242_47 TaxID=3374626 RepID=UPI0037A07584
MATPATANGAAQGRPHEHRQPDQHLRRLRAEESLDGLLLRMIDDDQVRHLIAAVVTDSLPLGGMVARDPRLQKPPKQKLRIGAVGRLLAELAPTYSATASSVLAAPGWSTATAGRPHFRPSLTPMTRAR